VIYEEYCRKLEVPTGFVNQKNWKEMESQSNHLAKVHELWKLLRKRTNEGTYELDGQHLHIAEVVATAQYDNQIPSGRKSCTYMLFRQSSIPYLSQDPKLNRLLQGSSDVLFDHLSKGWYVYGMRVIKGYTVCRSSQTS
jgi:phenylalanine ammonia-lyase